MLKQQKAAANKKEASPKPKKAVSKPTYTGAVAAHKPVRKPEITESTGETIMTQRPSVIPQKQWELPAGFKEDGSFATLAEVVSDPVPTTSLESLSTRDKKSLVLERIRQQDDYPTRYMLGAGKVDKGRAITEVEAGTPVGKVIEETEQRLIQMLESAAKTSS